MKKLPVILALAMAGAAHALAQNPAPPSGGGGPQQGGGPGGPPPRPDPESIFKQMDTNGDGIVSLDEFKAFRPPPPPQRPGGQQGNQQGQQGGPRGHRGGGAGGGSECQPDGPPAQ